MKSIASKTGKKVFLTNPAINAPAIIPKNAAKKIKTNIPRVADFSSRIVLKDFSGETITSKIPSKKPKSFSINLITSLHSYSNTITSSTFFISCFRYIFFYYLFSFDKTKEFGKN